MMKTTDIQNMAWRWTTAKSRTPTKIVTKYYCSTRDVFQTRLDTLMVTLLKSRLEENLVYLITSIVGEIGSNSFDHNIGKWPDIPGIFFAHNHSSRQIVLADRGQGILKTLKEVKPSLGNDVQALQTAFQEKLSGRAPENRGNGLKFVRQTIQDQKLYLFFFSGSAKLQLNKIMNITAMEPKVYGCLAILQF